MLLLSISTCAIRATVFSARRRRDTEPPLEAARETRRARLEPSLNAGAEKTIADNFGRKPIDRVCDGGNKQHKDATIALLR